MLIEFKDKYGDSEWINPDLVSSIEIDPRVPGEDELLLHMTGGEDITLMDMAFKMEEVIEKINEHSMTTVLEKIYSRIYHVAMWS